MRYQDWPLRLNQLLLSAYDRPFAWGEHDCCLFAANAVKELTGNDPAASLRDSYSDAMGAARILAQRGGVRAIATGALGEEINPLMAQRGDIVMVSTDDHGDTLAVCIGARCVAPGIHGLRQLPMSQAIAAWRVK